MSAWRANPTLGYPSRRAAIEALWDQGLKYRQIADRVGLSESAVAAIMTRIRRRRAKVSYKFRTGARNPFRKAAIRRGTTQEDIVTRLLETIEAEPVLIDNILDDDGGAV